METVVAPVTDHVRVVDWPATMLDGVAWKEMAFGRGAEVPWLLHAARASAPRTARAERRPAAWKKRFIGCSRARTSMGLPPPGSREAWPSLREPLKTHTDSMGDYSGAKDTPRPGSAPVGGLRGAEIDRVLREWVTAQAGPSGSSRLGGRRGQLHTEGGTPPRLALDGDRPPVGRD